MTELNEYFEAVSDNSKFPCNLGNLGGFVNFRNSGQRGSAKEFTLSLESILSGLKDIKSNLEVFKKLTRYVEKDWRDNGSKYFTDLILNSMITVQTKPCFTTFSKIINWATDAKITDYDDNLIDLSPTSIDTAIRKVESLSLSFSPQNHTTPQTKITINSINIHSYLSKPFLLLAGISGTGKTRFVREQAKTSRQFTETYCLTSVRPDWHEPSDLLGYISRLNGNAEYITTDVLQFIAKAWRGIADTGLNIEVQNTEEQGERLVVLGERDALEQVLPYWLCLDEMNLAPVEQYFADYLSVLETREWHWEDESFTYSCDALLKPATIKAVENIDKLREELGFESAEYDVLWDLICTYGLGIPFNLLVAGTVNMDETTHGFSRKVIDRALSFDFGAFFPNNFDEFADFGTPTSCNKRLSYPIWSNASKTDLADTFDADGTKTVAFLSAVNTVLKNTPFELAFRALNELLLAVASSQPQDDLTLKAVWDDFMMCKVLPRIEGDTDKLTTSNSKDLLEELSAVLADQLAPIWLASETDETNQRPDLYREKAIEGDVTDEEKVLRIPCRSKAKLKWMSNRLASATFTSFWP